MLLGRELPLEAHCLKALSPCGVTIRPLILVHGERACRCFHAKIYGLGLEVAHVILLKLSKNLAGGHFLRSAYGRNGKRILADN